MRYDDNLIGKDVSDMTDLDLEIRGFRKSIDWLPIETYDMVQCGYPLSDHGEMIHRCDGGVTENNELLPATGMWCKTRDAMEIINKLIEELNRLHDQCYHNEME